MRQAQVLLFVMFIMLIAGTFGVLLADMWSDEQDMRSGDRDEAIAFYLAQAGLARGKITICYDVNNLNGLINATGNWPGPTIDDWDSTEMEVAGDNYTYRYNFSVDNFAGPQITITGRGEVLDASANVLAHREMSVMLDMIIDTDSDGIDDNFNNNAEVSETWREI